MKKILFALLLLVAATQPVCAQTTPPSSGVQSLKAGNSLREAGQYDRAEEFLIKGLERVKGNDYWEAFGRECLGLLYRDLGDAKSAATQFQKAVEEYRACNMDLSRQIAQSLYESVNTTTELFAGIEIGSKGVKGSVQRVRTKLDGTMAFSADFKRNANPAIFQATDQVINDAADSTRAIFESIRAKYPELVRDKKFFLAMSSGARSALYKAGKLDQAIKAIESRLSDYGARVELLDDCKESRLVFLSVIPKHKIRSACVYDIGSGNAKGGYPGIGGESFNCSSFDAGTATFAKEIGKLKDSLGISFKEAAIRLEPTLGPRISAGLDRATGVRNKGDYCLLGGIVWAMSTYMYPEYVKDDFHAFTDNAVKIFRDRALEHYNDLINPDMSRVEIQYLTDAKKASEQVQKVFKEEEIIAGAMILNELVKQLNSTSSGKKYTFSRLGETGWLGGYIVDYLDKKSKDLKDGRR